jgi:hypothetical protein
MTALKTSPALDHLLYDLLREVAMDADDSSPEEVVEYALDLVDSKELDLLIDTFGYSAVVTYIAKRLQ